MNALTNAQIAKELKITPILDKTTRIQEKLDTTCKQAKVAAQLQA